MKRTEPFSKNAKRNALLAGLFAVPPVGLLLLAAIGSMVPETEGSKTAAAKPKATPEERVKEALAANKGTKGMSDYEACLYNRTQLEEALGKGKSGMDCNRVKNWRPPAELVRIAKSQNLGFRCKESIKAALKDPNSYRELNRRYVVPGDNKVNVVINYTATNSFGGRVQNTQTCSYSL